jgi:hypothetical protein
MMDSVRDGAGRAMKPSAAFGEFACGLGEPPIVD